MPRKAVPVGAAVTTVVGVVEPLLVMVWLKPELSVMETMPSVPVVGLTTVAYNVTVVPLTEPVNPSKLSKELPIVPFDAQLVPVHEYFVMPGLEPEVCVSSSATYRVLYPLSAPLIVKSALEPSLAKKKPPVLELLPGVLRFAVPVPGKGLITVGPVPALKAAVGTLSPVVPLVSRASIIGAVVTLSCPK